MMPLLTIPDLDLTESRLLQQGVNVCRFNEILEAAKRHDPLMNGAFLKNYLDSHRPVDPDIRIGMRQVMGLAQTVDMVHSDFVRDQKIPKTACPAKPSMRGML